MVSDVVAGALFLRRILITLLGLTVFTGVLAGVTTVQAMNVNLSTCVLGFE